MRIIILWSLLLLGAFACKKNLPGGNSEIKGTVVHHSKSVPFADVYIKFNAREFPGPDLSLYDTQLKADAAGEFTFQCYKGDYYLYGRAVESGTPPVEMAGGIPVRIRYNETLEVELAVTEKH